MIFFGDQNSKDLSESIGKKLGKKVSYPDITVFPDGERRVHLLESVVNEDVVFLTTVGTSLDTYVLETAFLIDACKRSGALSITGIIPYIPYSRADHVFRDGEAVPLEVVIHVLETAGLTKILFADPHTIKTPEMFSIQVVDISALPLFAEKIKEIGFDKNNSTIISPDMGGLRRMEQLSEMLDNLPFASIEKERDYETGEIAASGIQGEIKKTCFIVDDIISSGRTIVQAVEKITALGAEKIYVFATHPILSEDASKILQDSKVEKIYVTDSLPVPKEKKFPKLEILSLSTLISPSLEIE